MAKNKVIVKNERGIKHIIKEITSDLHGTILCYEQYNDGKLVDQYFKQPNFRHKCYEPKRITFSYYGDSVDIAELGYRYLKHDYSFFDESKLIRNLESFNKFDKLYSLYFGDDGNAYVITSRYPLQTPLSLEIWSSRFCLEKAEAYLKEKSNVSDIKIRSSIVQNYDITGTHTLNFIYLPPEHMFKGKGLLVNGDSCSLERDKKLITHLGLDQFRSTEGKIEVDYD